MDTKKAVKPDLNNAKPANKISRRELLKMAVPFGRITLDNARCTGCGICALECPTEALSFTGNRETGAVELLFKQQVCIACNKCVETCPEHCLNLEHCLEIEKIGAGPVTLFKDEVVRCSGCGSPVGPRSMLNSIKTKVLATGQSLPQMELCPECKIRAHFSPLNDGKINRKITIG